MTAIVILLVGGLVLIGALLREEYGFLKKSRGRFMGWK